MSLKNILTKVGEVRLKAAETKKKIDDKLSDITSGYRENVGKAKAIELQRLKKDRLKQEGKVRMMLIEEEEKEKIAKSSQKALDLKAKRKKERYAILKKTANSVRSSLKKDNKQKGFKLMSNNSVWDLKKK